MFTERGFDGVTIEEIARAAGTSHMTFYRHFPTKESVVLDDPFDPLLGEAVGQQDPALAPLERARSGLVAALEHLSESDDADVLRRVKLAVSSPALRSRIWENNHRSEDVIADSLRRGGASDFESKVAAGAVLGALSAALIDWAAKDAPVPLRQALSEALGLLRESGGSRGGQR